MKNHIEYAVNALINEENAKIIARVNHLDNFTACYAERAFNFFLDSLDISCTDSDEYTKTYNAICAEATKKDNRGYENHIPSESPTIKAICKEAYDKLRG